MMQTIKLAEALLRRKELQAKVEVLKNIKKDSLSEVRGQRTKVTDSIDDVVVQVPKLYASQITEEFDWHARQLRLIDAAIQQTNWTADINVDPSVMSDYKPSRKLEDYKP